MNVSVFLVPLVWLCSFLLVCFQIKLSLTEPEDKFLDLRPMCPTQSVSLTLYIWPQSSGLFQNVLDKDPANLDMSPLCIVGNVVSKCNTWTNIWNLSNTKLWSYDQNKWTKCWGIFILKEGRWHTYFAVGMSLTSNWPANLGSRLEQKELKLHDWNTFVSIAPLTHSVSVSINTSIKIHMGFWLIQKYQC